MLRWLMTIGFALVLSAGPTWAHAQQHEDTETSGAQAQQAGGESQSGGGAAQRAEGGQAGAGPTQQGGESQPGGAAQREGGSQSGAGQAQQGGGSQAGTAPAAQQGGAPQCAPRRATPEESYPQTLINTPTGATSFADCQASDDAASQSQASQPNCGDHGATPTNGLRGQSPTDALRCDRMQGSTSVTFASENQPTSSSTECVNIVSNNTSADDDDTNAANSGTPPTCPSASGLTNDLPASETASSNTAPPPTSGQ